MRRPILLTGPRSTPETTARLYGISKRRAKQLTEMVEKSLAKRSYAHLYYDSSPESKNGAPGNGTRGQKLKAKNRGRAKSKAPSNGSSRARRKAAGTH